MKIYGKKAVRPGPTLITGACGWIGRCLTAALAAGDKTGLVRADLAPRPAGAGAPYRKCDCSDPAQALKLVRAVRPARIYHLAGSLGGDWESDYRANLLSARNVLDAVAACGLKCRVLLVGSAAEYGVPARNPVSEKDALNPISVYGFTKMLQTRLGQFYAKVYGLDVVVARPFNLYGPGVSPKLFPGRVEAQIKAYRAGAAREITVGRLDSVRDFLHIDEAVPLLRAVMERGARGEVYNIGSGRPLKISGLLKKLLAGTGIPYSAVKSAAAAPRTRNDVDAIYADTRKLRGLTSGRSR